MAEFILTVLVCVFVADFLTGFMHWLEDTYAVPSWPRPLDTAIAIPNIEHHRTPHGMAASGFINRNYLSVLIAAAVSVPVLLIWGFSAWPFLLTATLAAFGNEVHAWNHRPPDKNNRLIRFLQDAGLVQSRWQHGLHHRKPYDRYYCTLTNFANSILERLNFWRWLEWALRLPVKRGGPERQGF